MLQDDGEKSIKVIRKPLGVVAAITPWNFPVILLAWKLAPALARGQHGGGEAVAVHAAQPRSWSPTFCKTIVPAGVLNVVSGGNELGATLAQHPGVRKISFTGSVATGKKIMGYAADDLKRVTLELGGNDPAIVLDDVDPQAVAESLFWGAFQNSGQVCTGDQAALRAREGVRADRRRVWSSVREATKVGDGHRSRVRSWGRSTTRCSSSAWPGSSTTRSNMAATIEAGGGRARRLGVLLPADDRDRRRRRACGSSTRSSSARRCR